MVTVLLLMLLLAPARAIAEGAYQFKAEFSSPEIYPGEEVRCDFVLYTTLNQVDVEVAKFPEFRGYWKENTILRQGNIAIPYAQFSGTPWKRVVLGSYRLVPMMDEAKPVIQPMKIVLRDPFSRAGENEITMENEFSPALRIRPLPKVPATLSGPFSGAVGQFELLVDSHEVPFQQDEPALLRYSIRGAGNFQEITGAHMELPAGVTVLNKRSYGQGASPYQIQIFEVMLSVKRQEDVELPGLSLTFFDPIQGRYRRTGSEPIHLRFQANLDAAKTPAPVAVDLGPPARTWSRHVPLRHSLPFWAVNGLIAIACALLLARRIVSDQRAAYLRSPEYRKRLRREAMAAAFRSGDHARFLHTAEQLLVEWLREQSGHDASGPTRDELVRAAAKRLDPDALRLAREVFSARDRLAFAPSHHAPDDVGRLYEALSRLIAA